MTAATEMSRVTRQTSPTRRQTDLNPTTNRSPPSDGSNSWVSDPGVFAHRAWMVRSPTLPKTCGPDPPATLTARNVVVTHLHEGGVCGGQTSFEPKVQPGHRRSQEGSPRRASLHHQPGGPSHVLLSFDDYQRLAAEEPSIIELPAMPAGLG